MLESCFFVDQMTDWLTIYLFVCLSACLLSCLIVCLFVYLFIVYLCVCLNFFLFCLFVFCLFVYLFICYLFICWSMVKRRKNHSVRLNLLQLSSKKCVSIFYGPLCIGGNMLDSWTNLRGQRPSLRFEHLLEMSAEEQPVCLVMGCVYKNIVIAFRYTSSASHHLHASMCECSTLVFTAL